MSLRDQVVASFSDRPAPFDDAVFLKHTFPGCVFVRANTLSAGLCKA